MVINTSRVKSFLGCKRKTFHQYINHIETTRRAVALTDGAAFHAGIAAGLSTKDWEGAALKAAKQQFEKDKAATFLMPEEMNEAETHWIMVEKLIEAFSESYKDEDYEVLQPECEFDVEVPHSYHNCINRHWYDGKEHHFTPPTAKDIVEGKVHSPHTMDNTNCDCWVPHRLVGKTDAVVLWHGKVWLLEHKTTSILSENWWTQWVIDIQATSYMWGISKALPYKPAGVIVNAVRKPTQKQVDSWNARRRNKDLNTSVPAAISFGNREPYLRSEEQLAAFEQELREICNEWEYRICNGSWPKSNSMPHCFSYNRMCEYFSLCAEEVMCCAPSGDFVQRDNDYVDLKQLGKGA